MIGIIKHSKKYFFISGALLVLSLLSLVLFRLNLGMDFTGGSLLEVKFSEGASPAVSDIKAELETLGLGNINIQLTDNNTYLFRFKEVDEETHQIVLNSLNALVKKESEIRNEESEIDAGQESVEELRFDSIGPVIGNELKRKSFISIIIVILAIIIYIAWAFRKVSEPVSSWKYGVIAVIALIHDVLIILGVFSLLGYYLNLELDVAFVAALLTVLGYSVNDTIVVFDRIRENVVKTGYEHFSATVNLSVNETIVRSLNTSLTTMLVLLSIYLFGGTSIRYFILALLLGVLVGTYSSIFIASPLLVLFSKQK